MYSPFFAFSSTFSSFFALLRRIVAKRKQGSALSACRSFRTFLLIGG